jgi:hypothetical protein
MNTGRFSKMGFITLFAMVIAGCSGSTMSAGPGGLDENANGATKNDQTPLTGSIFTTESTCSGVDLNIYVSKDDVYLDGGPASPNGPGLPDGSYYVKVTEPDGTLLGTSIGSGNDTPAHVTDGEFDQCYQLSAIVIRASDSQPGYDDTTNPGGEYKVWVCQDAEFSRCKTDNFKIEENASSAELHIIKFYDVDADGINDNETEIEGWEFRIQDDIDWIRFTPIDIVLDPDDYLVTEFDPLESNWIHTTPTSVNVTLESGDDVTLEFGNVCLGPGGGRTLGFWSNKNGQSVMNDGGTLAPELALLSGLNLRNGSGANFDPSTYVQFRSWLLNATATNMAYMLSAQLAAMELNVEATFVSGGSLIYCPGATSANVNGFASVNAIMSEANTELGLHGLTLSGSPDRAYQETLKDCLDDANNNKNFVQPNPDQCPFTFPTVE